MCWHEDKTKVFRAPTKGNLQKLTQDHQILSAVQGYEIPFLEKAHKHQSSWAPQMSQEERRMLDNYATSILHKDAIHRVPSVESQFLSNLFVVKKV